LQKERFPALFSGSWHFDCSSSGCTWNDKNSVDPPVEVELKEKSSSCNEKENAMSATRDQNQKVAFVYSNLYQLYQKGKSAAQNSSDVAEAAPIAVSSKSGQSSQVLKTDDLHKPEYSSVKISAYNPAELIGKRVARPQSLPASGPAVLPAKHSSSEAVSSLKENLKALNDLHSRLRFMLLELEELVQK
jgi:hypothetical protein